MGRPEDQLANESEDQTHDDHGVSTGVDDPPPEETRKIEVSLALAEVIKINPLPGDTLFFKFKGVEFYNDDVNDMGSQLRKLFPYNKVVVMALPPDHDVELTTIAPTDTMIPEAAEPAKDCSVPTAYCNDCGCGKKERIEGTKK